MTLTRHDPSPTLEVDAWLARRVVAGMSVEAIMVAGGVSRSTACRWVRELVSVEDVRCGPWVAAYAIRRTMPPVRLEPWRPA